MTDFSQKIPFDDFTKNMMESPFDQKLPSKLSPDDTAIVKAFALSLFTVLDLTKNDNTIKRFVRTIKFSRGGKELSDNDIRKRLNILQKAGRLPRK